MKILIDKIAGITYNKNKVIPAPKIKEKDNMLYPTNKYFGIGYNRDGNDVYIRIYSNIKKWVQLTSIILK